MLRGTCMARGTVVAWQREPMHAVLTQVAGIVVKPVQGARRDGARGAAIGVGQGVVGFFVRPVLACMDIVAYTLNSAVTLVHEDTSHVFILAVRLPRRLL